MTEAGEKEKQAYRDYVKEKTPVYSLARNMLKAFLVGGLICVLGQILIHKGIELGMEEKESGTWCTLFLILTSAIATGWGIYGRLASFAGAGTLVPVTGFANSVAAAAVEYRKEGHIFGVGCKIFTIAGPVILYGILSSWILGLIYYIFS